MVQVFVKGINRETHQIMAMVSYEYRHMHCFDRIITLQDGQIISDGR